MNNIICYTSLLPPGNSQRLSFWDILCDDRWTDGGFTCPEELYSEVGNINNKLHAKQDYEFLLRAAKQYPVTAMGKSLLAPPCVDLWDAFCTDCYIIGKYQELLRENGYFDMLVTALLQQAMQMPRYESAIAFMEHMISRTEAYYEIDDNTRPILLYYGDDVCSNLLNYFIDALANALKQLRQRVMIFDCNKSGASGLTSYIGGHFKAIIGVQSPAFALKMQDNTTFLHDLIHGPKFNMIFDHPAWLKEELQNVPGQYYLLLHDRNYISFCQNHFPNLSGIIHFPPAGFLCEEKHIPMAQRKYDISFVGSYRDYRERLRVIYQYDKAHRRLAAHYISILRKHPDYTGEQALQYALQHFKLSLNSTEFLSLFYDMRQVYFCILLYFREKVIEAFLNAGMVVHVFGDSWCNSPFSSHPCLTRHPDVDALEGLTVMQNSKISLNIMSWHKDGLTERIFNSMLCKSVVFSDTTTALQEQFVDGDDLILFSLSELSTLPYKAKALLDDCERLTHIAENGYKKALSHHTWQQRAEQLLNLLDERI